MSAAHLLHGCRHLEWSQALGFCWSKAPRGQAVAISQPLLRGTPSSALSLECSGFVFVFFPRLAVSTSAEIDGCEQFWRKEGMKRRECAQPSRTHAHFLCAWVHHLALVYSIELEMRGNSERGESWS